MVTYWRLRVGLPQVDGDPGGDMGLGGTIVMALSPTFQFGAVSPDEHRPAVGQWRRT